MPEALFRAGVALSLAWGWPLFAAALLLGFNGLLRRGEVLGLLRCELILTCDLLSCRQVAFVRVQCSKTSRFMLRQHAKIRMLSLFAFFPRSSQTNRLRLSLFACSPAVFRRRWDEVFSFLHVPTAEVNLGVTPKSLRGSRATWLYQETEDIERIQWGGRWQQRRTLEHYLQDVAGQLLLASLTKSQRLHVSELSAFAEPLLSTYIELVPSAHS